MKFNFFSSRSNKERGQGFAEYALLIVFIAISTILVVAALNAVIESQFIDINKCIQNSGSRALTSSNCEEIESTPLPATTSSTSSSGSGPGTTTTSPTGSGLTANFTFSCTALSCTFNNTSSDSNGTIVGFLWEFNVSSSDTTEDSTFTFPAAGTYPVKLTITDDETNTRSITKNVTVFVNSNPLASFNESCSGLTCTFTNTSTDNDGAIASSVWTFGDSSSSTNTNAGKTYTAAGTYTVTLTVTDNNGGTNTASKSITVSPSAGNTPPTANFTFSCSSLVCSFTNSSTDSGGSIASSTWDFTNDGTVDSNTFNPSHTFAAVGTYSVKLTVTDNGGLTSSVTKPVTVTTGSNASPIANFTFSCNSLTCNFTSTSTDDGTIASYAWDFTDDSSTDSTTQNPSNTFASAGTYTARLTVTDNLGATGTVTKQVIAANNTAPTANFTKNCTNLGCTFTNASTDSDGSIASAVWDFTNDGTNDSTSLNTSHTYSAAGTYTVKLTVTDNGGLSASTTQTFTVTSTNSTPTASFNVSCVSKNCTFTDVSSDIDGTIVSWAWDFDNNGTPDNTTQNPTFTYSGGNNDRTARLTVTDNQGATNTTTKIFGMNDSNAAPTANFNVNCTGLTCSLTNTSTDGDGTIASYSWDFTNNGTPDSTSANPNTIYAAAGTYTIKLTVTDNDGATGSVTKTVTVTVANVAPTANFTFICTSLSCTFTNTSTDSDGTVVSSAWDFTADGTNDSTTTNATTTYAAAGTYSVKLTVTDNSGATGSKTVAVTVSIANASPTANFTHNCTNLACTFTNTSTDGDGTIASSAWDFTNDGSTDSASASPSNTFAAAGTYTVRLTVTDNGGATGTVTKSVTVTATNSSPTANFTFSCTGLTCNFTNTSTDGDGSIASSTWDFTNDGSTDSTTASPSNTYAAAGTYTAKLTVTDNLGATNTITKSVTVASATTMSIEAVSTASVSANPNWTGSVTFTVLNNLNAGVNNVTVTISALPAGTTAGWGTSLSCITNASGVCTISSQPNKKSGGGSVASYAVTITNVSGGGLTYVPANNSDTTDGTNNLTSTTTLTVNQ